MNFIALLLVMVPMSCALKPCSKDGKPCASRHFKNVSLGNQALRPSHLISSHNVHRLGECHILCVSQENCYGYNFRDRPSSIYTVNCQLSNNFVKMNMTRMKNGSWIFYEDVLVTEDIDECTKRSRTCGKNATCTNTHGSFKCQCVIGFSGDGHTCTDIDECFNISAHPCDINANCTNTNGSYQCKCHQGYLGNGHTCRDVDECADKSTHSCHLNATCTNTNGSYQCNCHLGYRGNGYTCTDIDECSERSHTCDENANCTNTHGSFKCQCGIGFSGDGRTCTDIDECSKRSDTCHTEATCNNTLGSYTCTCRSGYGGDGKNCQKIGFDSVILSGNYNWELKLKSWIGGRFSTAKLCWRATGDGWLPSTFHSNCDNKKPTITIVKVGQYVFGGYATASWEGSGYKQARGSFIFSLQNKETLLPFKAPLKDQNTNRAILVASNHGPVFGDCCDLAILSNATWHDYSFADLGTAYQPPSGVSDPDTILAGTYRFSLSTVEVFHLV